MTGLAAAPPAGGATTASLEGSLSVLWDSGRPPDIVEDPLRADALRDLRLDEIIEAVLAGRDVPGLRAAFEVPLDRLEAVRYRQAVVTDLEDPEIRAVVRAFGEGMAAVRRQLERARRAYDEHERSRWHLDAAATYWRTVDALADGLAGTCPGSAAFRTLADFVVRYRASAAAQTLRSDVERCLGALRRIRYRLHIQGNRIRVSRDRGEPDYGAEILATFEKFRQHGPTGDHIEVGRSATMTHVEAAILERVARLYPDVFGDVARTVARHADFIEPTLARFDAEVQFYLAYLDHIARLREAGLPFCLPVVEVGAKEVHGRDVFDLALADGLVAAGRRIVTNDVDLAGDERILVVTGPNQGGKTTFARAVGQLVHLAGLGLPVPGREVRVGLADRVLTHFERREELTSLEGKLERDLRRFRDLLAAASPTSLIVMNESFSATSAADALLLNQAMLRTLLARDARVVCVTFLDELSRLGPGVVSMVAAVDPADPTTRTYRVLRQAADGRAYALAVAEKHGLTYDRLRSRLARSAASETTDETAPPRP